MAIPRAVKLVPQHWIPSAKGMQICFLINLIFCVNILMKSASHLWQYGGGCPVLHVKKMCSAKAKIFHIYEQFKDIFIHEVHE
jgi:hypothetical protein